MVLRWIIPKFQEHFMIQSSFSYMDIPEKFPSRQIKAYGWRYSCTLINGHGELVAIWVSITGMANVTEEYWGVQCTCLFNFIYWPGHGACGILVPPSGVEPVSPALKGEVLTTVSLRKSPVQLLRSNWWEVLIATLVYFENIIWVKK